MENNNHRLLRKEEFAYKLQVSLSSINRMIKSGELKPIQIGKNQLRFSESLLDDFIKTPITKTDSGKE